MARRSLLPYIGVAAAVLVTGLLLGAGRSSEDSSAANTASKILLTVGFVALVVTVIAELVSRQRARRAQTTTRRIP